MKPQTAAILKHLNDVGTITNVEAQAVYKSRSLTKRISEIREAGYDIKSEWKRDHTGQRYVRYWLRKKTPNEVLPPAEFVSLDTYQEKLAEFNAGNFNVVSSMFIWEETPQGHAYWGEVYGGLHTEEAKATLEKWRDLLLASSQKEAA